MVRQYVGARYIPKFADPVEWANGTSYEALTVVTFNNASYTSKVPVPPTVGNPADNPQYWALTGNYNAQVEEYRQETENYNAQVEQYRQETENYNAQVKEYRTEAKDAYDIAYLTHEKLTKYAICVNAYDGTDDEKVEKAISDAKSNGNNATLYFPYGNYDLLNTHTFNTPVVIDGYINNSSALTFKSPIYATPKRIFNNGSLVSLWKGQAGYAEWFGTNNLQTAINALHELILLPTTYKVSNNIIIDKPGFILKGTKGIVDFSINSMLRFESNATLTIGKTSANTALEMASNITMEDLFISSDVGKGNTPILIKGTYLFTMRNVNAIAYTGNLFRVANNIALRMEYCNFQVNTVARVIYASTEDLNADWGFAGVNASFYIGNTTFTLNNSEAAGIILYGKGADTFLFNVESVGGILIVMKTASGTTSYNTHWDDITFSNIVCDNVNSFLRIENINCTSPAFIKISNVWAHQHSNDGIVSNATNLGINGNNISLVGDGIPIKSTGNSPVVIFGMNSNGMNKLSISGPHYIIENNITGIKIHGSTVSN